MCCCALQCVGNASLARVKEVEEQVHRSSFPGSAVDSDHHLYAKHMGMQSPGVLHYKAPAWLLNPHTDE